MGQFQTDFLMLVREDVTNTVFFFSAFAASYKKRVILKSRVLQQPKAEVQYKLNNAPTPKCEECRMTLKESKNRFSLKSQFWQK